MISKKLENKLKKIQLLLHNVRKEVESYNVEHIDKAWEEVEYVRHLQQNHRLIKNQASKRKH